MRLLVNTIYSGYRRIIPQVIVFKREAGDILYKHNRVFLRLGRSIRKTDLNGSVLRCYGLKLRCILSEDLKTYEKFRGSEQRRAHQSRFIY